MDLFGWTSVTKCYKNVTECHIFIVNYVITLNVIKLPFLHYLIDNIECDQMLCNVGLITFVMLV